MFEIFASTSETEYHRLRTFFSFSFFPWNLIRKDRSILNNLIKLEKTIRWCICSKCIIFLVTDDGRSVVNNKEFSTKGFYFWFIFQIASDRIFLKRILCRVINADGFTRKVKISLRRTKLLSYERFYFIYLLFIFNRTYTRSNHIIIFPSVAILDSFILSTNYL